MWQTQRLMPLIIDGDNKAMLATVSGRRHPGARWKRVFFSASLALSRFFRQWRNRIRSKWWVIDEEDLPVRSMDRTDLRVVRKKVRPRRMYLGYSTMDLAAWRKDDFVGGGQACRCATYRSRRETRVIAGVISLGTDKARRP